MVKAVLIDKAGEIKAVNLKVEKDELYKKCKFKSTDSFTLRHTWKIDKSLNRKIGDVVKYVSIYAKDTGRANMENKYDLPPPVDHPLFFGCLIMLGHNTSNVLSEEEYNDAKMKEGDDEDKEDTYLEYVDPSDLTTKSWNLIYENLFGGFEDLSATAIQDELEEDELENIPDKMKTSTGYLKDDFVVDDDEELVMDGDESSEESEFLFPEDQELQFEEYEYSDEDKLVA